MTYIVRRWTSIRDGTRWDFREPTWLVTLLLNRPVDYRNNPVDWRKLSALDWPIDRQKFQHLDQTLPRQTEKTAVYTTVRLHYVNKCQLSQHYHISIKWKKIANFVVCNKCISLLGLYLKKCPSAFYVASRSRIGHLMSRPDRQPVLVDLTGFHLWPACQLSRSKVISFKNDCLDSQTHIQTALSGLPSGG